MPDGKLEEAERGTGKAQRDALANCRCTALQNVKKRSSCLVFTQSVFSNNLSPLRLVLFGTTKLAQKQLS